MTNVPASNAAHEITTLARVFRIQDIPVSVRCFKVTEHKIRYEIVLDSDGEIAVVDVAAREEQQLIEHIELSAECFAAAIWARKASNETALATARYGDTLEP
ncbi:MAG: hypothetical protein MJE77_07060 [Proteobacteria bacterium]|nr:hypothetical protein [Pseudomonadota bacterium]